MLITVHDPQKNLPEGWQTELRGGLQGDIFVSAAGVPIHPLSWHRFCQRLTQGQPLEYIPEIPVASELGLPKYGCLLSWKPKPQAEPSGWRRMLRRILGRPAETEPGQQQEQCRETTEEEQIHYFVDHLAKISSNPRQVSVVVSNVCNLQCIMCPYHGEKFVKAHQTRFFHEPQMMDWVLMRRIADECGRLGIPIKMGNVEEPLLHPRLADFVSYSRQQGAPSVHITTNGTLLTKDVAEKLLAGGLTSLYISLDAAYPETYRHIRNDSLDEVEQNIKAFIELRNALGKQCLVMLSFVRNDLVSEEEELAFRAKWLPLADGVIYYNLADYTSGTSKYAQINSVAGTRLKQAEKRWPCLNPWQEVYILPDGRVFYCCDTVSKLAYSEIPSMGDYRKVNLQGIWTGPMFSSLRVALIRNQLKDWVACHGCNIWMAHVGETTTENDLDITRNMITEIYRSRK